MASTRRLWGIVVAAALLGSTLAGSAQAAGPAPSKPQPFSDLYIASYNGGCTHTLSVILNHRVTKSWEPVGGPCAQAPAMAVGKTIRTIGVRPGEVGAEYTLGRNPTGVTYDYPDSIYMDIPDGTTDGRSNYAGGYFDGVVYQFTRDWKNPVPLFSTGLYLGGITYDSHTRTLWVLDSRYESGGGLGEIRNYRKDGTLLSSFVVRGGSTELSQPFGLAYDPRDDSLWISLNRQFDQPVVLEKYSTDGTYLASVTTKLTGVALGMEFRLPRACRHHGHHGHHRLPPATAEGAR